MPKDTPSMAKNKIKRCLRAILDPHPSQEEIGTLWAHFDSRCVYCGNQLDRQVRQGHLDHAVPTTSGGTNSIHSHVLACAKCNGDEKREEEWEKFLSRKCLSPEIFDARRLLILEWLSRGNSHNQTDLEIMSRADAIVRLHWNPSTDPSGKSGSYTVEPNLWPKSDPTCVRHNKE
jgi:hypothetical protein